MYKIILGVIVGFIVWTIVWVGGDQLFQMLSPGWFRVNKDAMALAVGNGEAYRPDAAVIIIDLVRSAIASILGGFLAAVVAGENRRTPLILGILLLVVGIAVQTHLWNVFPIWFHLIFLVTLIPLAILGGRIKGSA